MLSKNTRIAKLYTVLTKPTHKRKKKDLRLCVSMLGKYLEECLNQSRSLPMNNPTLLKQLCRFVTVKRHPLISNENGTPLYNENEKANEAYIVLQGSVEERRMFTQIELISAIDQLKKLMFQFDQLFDNIRNLLSDFTTGYSSQLIVARNKKKQQQKVNATPPAAAATTATTTASTATEEEEEEENEEEKKVRKKEEKTNQTTTSIFKEITEEYYSNVKPIISKWGENLVLMIEKVRTKPPPRDRLPKEKNINTLINYIENIIKVLIKCLQFYHLQKEDRKLLKLEVQRIPNVRYVEKKALLLYKLLSKIEDIVFQISLFLCKKEDKEELISYRSPNERFLYLNNTMAIALKAKEDGRKFGAVRIQIGAWDGTIGKATFSKSNAIHNGTALCTGPSGATLAILNRKAILPILKDGFQVDMLTKTKFIRSIKEFKLWSSTKIIEMVYRMEPETFKKNSKIIARGTMARYVYIIYKGFVSLYTPIKKAEDDDWMYKNISDGDIGTKIRELGPGAILGERAMLKGSLVHGFSEAVASSSEVNTLKIRRSVFDEMVLSSSTSRKVFLDTLKSQNENKEKWRNQWKKLAKVSHPPSQQSVYTSMTTMNQHTVRKKLIMKMKNEHAKRKNQVSKDNNNDRKNKTSSYIVESVRNKANDASEWIKTDEERLQEQQRYKAQVLLGSEQDILLAVKEALREEARHERRQNDQHLEDDLNKIDVNDTNVNVREYIIGKKKREKTYDIDKEIEVKLPRKNLLKIAREIFSSPTITKKPATNIDEFNNEK